MKVGLQKDCLTMRQQNKKFKFAWLALLLAAAGLFFSFNDKAVAAIEQEGFSFRADDGSESGATWATQDTDISRAKNTNTRLRFLIDATNDPTSQQFQIEYKK
jgi:hypothetical protein